MEIMLTIKITNTSNNLKAIISPKASLLTNKVIINNKIITNSLKTNLKILIAIK